MNNETRIRPNMSIPEVLYAITEGNPGATTVVMDLMLTKPNGMLQALMLDTFHIYGSQIWGLYKDCCGEDLDKMVLSLRLFQMGAFTKEQIRKNLSADRPVSFIDEDLALDDSVYDMKKDHIVDMKAFEEWIKAQGAFYRKKHPEDEGE